MTGKPTWTLSGFGDEIDPDPVVQAAVLLALGARHVEVRGAHRLGTRYVRIFSFYRPPGVPVEQTRDLVLTRLRALADLAGTGEVVPVGEGQGGFSGPAAFGRAARAFRDLTTSIGVQLG